MEMTEDSNKVSDYLMEAQEQLVKMWVSFEMKSSWQDIA